MANNFTTGSTLLPDVGTCAYNGCTFSPLFYSNVSAKAARDEAGRTIKYTDISLSVDGYVTMGDQARLDGIASTMRNMHLLLTAQGGSLTYKGRGFDLVVNGGAAGGRGPATSDVAWGPVPELIEFQPMGGGLSAKVVWRVTVRVSPMTPGGTAGQRSPLLQFNYETSVGYSEDGYSTLSLKGTLEIPMTRSAQKSRTVPTTADSFRPEIERRLLKNLDLNRFRVTRRSFDTSTDKRTLKWNFELEEKPYMDLPPGCPVARGNYTVRPVKSGPGLALWLCTLTATYTLRADFPRRNAYLLFMSLMRLRMAESKKGFTEDIAGGGGGGIFTIVLGGIGGFFIGGPIGAVAGASAVAVAQELDAQAEKKEAEDVKKATLIDFNFNEGLYLDSKTVTFSATWRISTNFSHILLASGIWTKLREKDNKGNNLWAISMRDVSGSNSWLTNRLDPALDIIVDFGSTE